MNRQISWRAIDGRLMLDYCGHFSTLTRLSNKQWRAHVVIRKQRSGGGSYKVVRQHSNGFNTRREAAVWALQQMSADVTGATVDAMKFASLKLEDWRA